MNVFMSLALVTYFHTLFSIFDHGLPIIPNYKDLPFQSSNTQMFSNYSFMLFGEGVGEFFYF